MGTLQSLTINDTGSITLPSGTGSNRPTVTRTVVSFTTTTSTTWTVPANVTSVEVLVVAGGGGGGSEHGGGGGAGGVVYVSNYPVTPGASIDVTVGAGGAGGAYSATNGGNNWGTNGSNSRFGNLVAIGGGGGAPYQNSAVINSAAGRDGGSGGGGGATNPGNAVTASLAGLLNAGGVGTNGQGNDGGRGGFWSGVLGSGNYCGGGGGGAGGRGGDAGPDPKSAFGGPGLCFSITGTPTYYGGGGGSSYYGSATAGPGGIGGGGASGSTASYAGVNGTSNTGGGGGGSYDNAGSAAVGGTGGSGVVIVRYALTATSTAPVAQTRFNTETKRLETYRHTNKWDINYNGEAIVTNGLRCYLDPKRYAGSGTTVYDQSGNDYNATLNGTITHDANTGYFDLGTTANVTNYITIPSTALNGATEFTVSMWLYVNVANGIDTFFTCGAGNDLLFFFNGRNLVNFQNTVSQDYKFTSSLGEWIHFTATGKNGVVTLYKNGNLMESKPGNSTVTVTSTLGIVLGNEMDASGGSFETTQAFLGRYGPIMLYNKAISNDDVKRNFNAQRGRFGLWPTLINTGAAAPGATPGSAATSARQIKELTGTTNNDFYWIKPLGITGTSTSYGITTGQAQHPIRLWCDMNYDGGGWALVMNNCKAGAITGAGGTNGIGAVSYYQAVNNVTYNGSLDKRMGFRTLVGLKYWTSLGLNMVQFCSASAVTLSQTSSHTKRYRMTYTGINNTYGFIGAGGGTEEIASGGTPGFYDHMTGGHSLTTTDVDQDQYGSNCSNLYGGVPWWYTACWGGNMWGGGNSGGYQDGPFWSGSGSDYHNYMAVYLKV